MLIYKIDVLKVLKDAGYSSYVLIGKGSNGKIILGSTQVQKLRDGQMIGINALEKICDLTGLQPGDLIESVPEDRVQALIESGYFEKKGLPNPRK